LDVLSGFQRAPRALLKARLVNRRANWRNSCACGSRESLPPGAETNYAQVVLALNSEFVLCVSTAQGTAAANLFELSARLVLPPLNFFCGLGTVSPSFLIGVKH